MNIHEALWQIARGKMQGLLKLNAYQTGKFKLTSGRESDWLIDCKKVILTAEGHALCAELLLPMLDTIHAERAFRAVAAVPVGACSLASVVAFASWQRAQHRGSMGMVWDALYVRKEAKAHGSRDLIVGGSAVPVDSEVVLVEDVFTTGGSAKVAVQALRDAGYKVSYVVALVDRQEGATEALAEVGVKTVHIYTAADFRAAV